MANPALGFTAALGMGEEGAYGTIADRTKFVEIDSESIKVEERQIRSPSVYAIGHRSNKSVQGAVAVQGDLVFSPQFGGWLKLLKHTLGSVVTVSPDPTNAPTVYKHTFEPADYLPTGLTFEIQKDPTTVPNATFIVSGAKISQLQMQVSADSNLQVTASIIAREITTTGVPTTPVFSTTKMIPGTIGAVTWDGGSLDVMSLNLGISNNLATDRRFLGSRFIKEPFRSDKFLVGGTFATEFQSMSQWTDFRNDLRKQLILDFVGDVIAGGLTYRMKITLPISRVMDFNPNVSNPGIISVEVPFECYRDDSNKEIKIEIWNTDPTV